MLQDTTGESHYTKYYKLVVFIVDMIFIPSLGYFSHSTVAATDTIAPGRIKGDTR
jgi:hypothetical protein